MQVSSHVTHGAYRIEAENCELQHTYSIHTVVAAALAPA